MTRAPGSLTGVPGCRGGLRPGCCCLFVSFIRETSSLVGPEWIFHLFTYTMGFAPIKGTCTVMYTEKEQEQFTDWTMMVERQSQEKKKFIVSLAKRASPKFRKRCNYSFCTST